MTDPTARCVVRYSAAGLWIALVLGLWGCGDAAPGPDPDPEPGPPTQLEVRTGGGQTGTVGQPLAAPIVVRVTDAEGRGVPGVQVAFSTSEVGGAFAPESRRTDENGEAESVWTLGSGSGTQRATAALADLAPASLSAAAEPEPAARLAFEAAPAEASAGVALSPPVVVAVQDRFGNLVPTSSAEIGLEVNKGALSGTAVRQATDGVATFPDLRIDQAGTGYVLTATAAGLTSDESEAFAVTGEPVAASVEVSPRPSGLLVDQTASLTATVLDDQGRPMEDATVTWSSSGSDVASVDADGVVTARAVGGATITATSGAASGSAEVTVSFGEGTLTNVTYCTIDGIADKMDVYIPSASKPRPLPVAVHVHGGGWVSGNRSTGTRFAEMKQVLLDRGYLVASLDYRLAPANKYPAQIQDVKCAIRHLRARASRYGLDAGRIGAWGGSAGGQLVALLGTAGAGAGFDDVGGFQGESSDVQAVIAISAITDFTSPDELNDDYGRVFRTWPDPESPEMIEASPVTHVTPGDAPFFFIVGDEDQLVLPAQSVRMNQLLQDAGVLSSLLRVLHADHDLLPVSGPIDPTSETITARMTEFFDQHLR